MSGYNGEEISDSEWFAAEDEDPNWEDEVYRPCEDCGIVLTYYGCPCRECCEDQD